MRISSFTLLLLLPFGAFAQWPDFRGPLGTGHAPASGPHGLPTTWSENENIVWKVAIPHKGWSSPVIEENHIWLTTALADGKAFYVVGVDAASGKILVHREIFTCAEPEPLGNAMNCYASPSPVIEPGRVYVHFGSYGTACLDAKTGATIWQRTDIPCRHYRGPGSSPVLYKNLLILTMDGIDRQYLIALDKTTGKTVWKVDRNVQWGDIDPKTGKAKNDGDFRKAYSTPIFTEVNGKTLMISVGSSAAFAYDPLTGKEIWKVRHGGFSGGARPVVGAGLVFLPTGHGRSEIIAVKPDGQGDITDTHIVWRTVRGVPKIPSPIVIGDHLYLLSDGGILACWDAKAGKEIWKERLPGEYVASPLYADGCLYCLNNDGRTTVIRPGDTFTAVALNKLDSGFMASPAVLGKALILRTKTHLLRVEVISTTRN